ncbi:prepilin-type N-terminal cleavage/methylation domain-containing protein [Brumicola nitratireducens]|uniref:Methylation site containing protein n=1 Tax=Glaciecola nitratireducens (strain JCM 12485 / KCTC 12276 / FR1064) TaxID=1085623 RepID=G4QFF2_GLANF|nr:prepilin-type N-terminal cleavage/methylation domain-containing protein [Glaciecola nitratireducens]AEP28496.1 methylation site containing protein [Glaciecola nitratireducens FR1064]
MKNQMNKQKGFTLIELIIVIVILGILAVTAAPRFIDLQSDAKASTLDGVKAALQGASQLVYAKAAIAGVQGSATAELVDINGTDVSTINGYPNAIVITDFTDLAPFLELDGAEFDLAKTAPTDDNFEIFFEGKAETDNCFIRYTNAGANSSPLITVIATGC